MMKKTVVNVLGTRVVASSVRRLLRGRLRILAHHGVPDVKAFDAQLRALTAEYSPVSGEMVVRHLQGLAELPTNPIWVTFDDGWSNVVDNALPLLLKHGVPGTLFVCPGLVEDGRTHWWETVASAERLGWQPSAAQPRNSVRHLKSVPDDDRRRAVQRAEVFLGKSVQGGPRPASRSQLERWSAEGLEIGNHTWDHPCLDQCSVDEQRRQIVQADDWLTEFGAFDRVKLFAYPNGDWTSESEGVLRELGYGTALLFDHRLATFDATEPLRLSRLRIDASASIRRWRAIASGGHAQLFRQKR
jgi:peptidoglycan/xylan/chitin deacetylase (PgdA/CDA1 family)